MPIFCETVFHLRVDSILYVVSLSPTGPRPELDERATEWVGAAKTANPASRAVKQQTRNSLKV